MEAHYLNESNGKRVEVKGGDVEDIVMPVSRLASKYEEGTVSEMG